MKHPGLAFSIAGDQLDAASDEIRALAGSHHAEFHDVGFEEDQYYCLLIFLSHHAREQFRADPRLAALGARYRILRQDWESH